MKLFRTLLVCLLSLSIPATALSSVVSQSQCEQRHASANTRATDSDHHGHAVDQQHGNHGQHGAGGNQPPPTDQGNCNHCSTGHCASGCATTLASNNDFFPSAVTIDTELPTLPGSHTAGAHSLELLRPPSLG